MRERLPAKRKKIVVGFAGAGGACFGLREAFGVDPDAAMNHWPVAIAAHERHFPDTAHYLGDIVETDPRDVLPGERIGFAWFSPDCTDHSKAKGKAPKSERIRGLAWVILKWVVTRRPDVIMLENVEEWFDWGPVYRCPDDVRAAGVPGSVGEPIKALRGQTRERFVRRLEKAGATVEIRYLVAADFGDPTTRKRLVMIARFDGKPIVWPDRTHAPRHLADELDLKPWVGAHECIDFSLPCPSLFLTPEEVKTLRRETGVICKRPVVFNTERRIARGLERHVMGSREPFIVPVTHAADRRTHAATDPIRTVTGASRGEFALVDPLVSPVVVGCGGRRGQSPPMDVRGPAPTVTGKNDACLAAASLIRTDFQSAAERNGIYDQREPIRTVTSAGGVANLSAFLVPRYGERPGQDPRCRSVEDPYPTAVPDGNGGGLAAVHLHQSNTRDVGADTVDPLRTHTGHVHQGVVSALLGRQFGSNVTGRDIREPAPTGTAGGGKGGGHDQVIAAYMAQGNGDRVGRAAQEPVTTLTERSTQQQLVAASLQSYYRTGEGSDCADPMRAVTREDRHALIAACLEQANTGMVGHSVQRPISTIVEKGCTQRLIEARLELEGGPIGRRAQVLQFLWKHFGAPTDAEWDDPAATLQARLKFGLVILQGPEGPQVWMIVDIGLRMLKARELGRAMGLPRDVDFDVDALGRPITTTDQVAMIGNMVCPGLVEALAEANAPDWTLPERCAA